MLLVRRLTIPMWGTIHPSLLSLIATAIPGELLLLLWRRGRWLLLLLLRSIALELVCIRLLVWTVVVRVAIREPCSIVNTLVLALALMHRMLLSMRCRAC